MSLRRQGVPSLPPPHLQCGTSSRPSTPSPNIPKKDFEALFSPTFDITKTKSLTPAYTGQRVCDVVRCFRCQKPRCIYASKPLTSNYRHMLQEVKNTTVFACGTALLLPGHSLEGRVYTKSLNCSAPVQRAFYTSSFADFDVCSQCGGKNGEVSPECTGQARKYGPNLPLCEQCKYGSISLLTDEIQI